MIRVVHVLSALNVGGIELRLLDLVRILPKEQVETTIITLSSDPGVLADAFKDAGAHVVPVPLGGARFGSRFRATLRAVSPHALHSHAFLASGYFLLHGWLARVPVRIAHFQSDKDQSRSVLRLAREWILRTLISLFATVVIGVSDHSLEAWSGRWRRSRRAVVLTNGLDLAAISQRVATQTRTIRERPVVLHVGRADLPTKNRGRAVEILGAFSESEPSAVLVFVGRDGADEAQSISNREALSSLSELHGVTARVRYLGERDDVIELMSDADVLLFTSSREGVPGTVVEALASGLPVVASDLPGCRFIAERVHEGLECVSLAADDRSWAAALERAIRRPRPPRGSSPLSRSDFNVAVTAARLVEIWSGRS